MKKNVTHRLFLRLLALGFISSLFVPSFAPYGKESVPSNEEGVFICEDTGKKGPIFYPAEYSSDITDEPNYSIQNGYTFSSMNYNNAHKYYRGDSVKVAIIDSGLNYTHEDFIDTNSNQIIQGNSRTIDNTSGSWLYYQFSSGYQSKIVDSLGHGTNVASVIASQINALGCAGIAPNVELYIYKVTNTSNGYEWTAINSALSYCISEGIDVINMSFQAYEHSVTYNGSTMPASTGCSSVMTSYINSCYNAGITLVAAAGNYNTSEPSYPASNNHVISVGSLAESSTTAKAAYSNTYGIDLVAPGTVYVADKGTNSAYKKTSGTSFSAPIVTAAIALYKQQNPTATPSQIESALYASCDSISGNPSWAGNGRLNIDKFLGVDVQDAPVEIVINNPEIVDEELELEIGDYLDLDYTVNGVGTFDDSVNFYTFSGEDSVVSVNSNGRITATGVGSDYVVTESNADSNVYASVYVTVSDSTVHVTGVFLNKNSTTITVGSNETLTATVSPNNATNKSVQWSSSNTSVATVSNGTVTAVATGNATITVTTVDGSYTATCTVTVEAAPQSQTLTITMNSFTNASTAYAWYNWTQTTTDSTSISGKGELYKPDSSKMQFNKSKGNKVAAIFNTTAIPGSITKIEATSQQTTIRSWTAYVTSTACSGSGSTLTFGSNKTTVGTVSPAVGTSTSFGTSNAGYSYFCIQENDSSASYISEFKITYTPKSLSSISIKTVPTKTTYEAGENFDPTGLVITKTFSDNTTVDVPYAGNAGDFTFDPTTSTALTTSDVSVTITYGGKSCNQAITVTAAKTLSSISISGYTTSFVEGDEFTYGGIVTATFSDSSSLNVTNESTFTGYNMTSVDNQTVTVSYTYKGVTKTQTYNINVAIGTLTSIAVSEMTLSYVKNSSFSFDGTCTATFANGYQKVVEPTSVSSPDMSKTGNKTITVSYTYNGKTETTEYIISVTSYREVIETTTTSIYCTYDFSKLSGTSEITSTSTIQNCYSNSGGITGTTTDSKSNTYANNGYLRLATGKNSGSVSFSFGSFNITDVTVVAHGWSDSEANCNMTITNGGTITTTSSSTNDTFNVHLTSATNSITINSSKNNRICIQSITFYVNTTTTEDIGHSEDCVGLESFIDNYMHMDYTDNLGYCSDSAHHYYATAKDAFNDLNEHQRKLFTSNSAYLVEWTRLSTWASKNGDSLNATSILSSAKVVKLNITNGNNYIVIVLVSGLTIISIIGFFALRKKKKD